MNTERRRNGFNTWGKYRCCEHTTNRSWGGGVGTCRTQTELKTSNTCKQGVFDDVNQTWTALAMLSTPRMIRVSDGLHKLNMNGNKTAHMHLRWLAMYVSSKKNNLSEKCEFNVRNSYIWHDVLMSVLTTEARAVNTLTYGALVVFSVLVSAKIRLRTRTRLTQSQTSPPLRYRSRIACRWSRFSSGCRIWAWTPPAGSGRVHSENKHHNIRNTNEWIYPAVSNDCL